MRVKRTKSAKLSSSCPSRLELFLHRATLPSKKSNIRPANGNACACHKCRRSCVMRYCADEKIERDPQKPFIIVTRSARRKLLMMPRVRPDIVTSATDKLTGPWRNGLQCCHTA